MAEGLEQTSDLQVPPPPLPGHWIAVVQKLGQQYWLTDHDLSVTTFGRERDGGLLVGDFGGRIARLAAVE